MKSRTTLILFLAVCVVGFAIYWVDRDQERHSSIHSLKARVLPFQAEDVEFLRIEHTNSVFECVKQDADWFIQQPIKSRGDAGVIEGILSELELLRPLEVITTEQRAIRGLDLKDYGLSEPRMHITIRDAVQERTLWIGTDAPLGDWVYAKLASFPEVISLPKAIVSALPETVQSLRDPHLLPRTGGRITRIDMFRPAQGFVRLVREGSRWKLMQPISCHANSEVVQQLLTDLHSATIQDFVWDAASVSSNTVSETADALTAASEVTFADWVDTHGLARDEAPVRVEVWVEDGLTSQELTLGKPVEEHPETVYAIRRDVPSVFAVSTNLLNTLSLNVNDLRSRRVFDLAPRSVDQIALFQGEQRLVITEDASGEWLITQPVQWKADRRAVDALLQSIDRWSVHHFVGDAETNAATQAVNAPWCVIELAQRGINIGGAETEESPEPKAVFNVIDHVTIGAHGTRDVPVFMQRRDVEGFVALTLDDLNSLPVDPTNPLNYRNREVVAISSEDIHRITRVSQGVTQTVARAESGAWQVDGGSNRVSIAAVTDILFRLSDLRALRVEALSPDSLVPFGLENERVQLTVGLRGDQGIQKSLLFGFKSRTDGVFATVQGLDVVFAFAHDDVKSLTQDLVTTDADPGDGGPPSE